jgi:hypothetical protein
MNKVSVIKITQPLQLQVYLLNRPSSKYNYTVQEAGCNTTQISYQLQRKYSIIMDCMRDCVGVQVL